MAAMRGSVIFPVLLLFAAGVAAAREPGIAVMGRVLDSGGKPIGDARVELHPLPSHPEAAARAASGPDGRFVLRAPQPGLWRIVVAADGYVPRQRLLPLLEDAGLPPAELLLVPESAPSAIQDRFPAVPPGGWEPVERRGAAGAGGGARLPASRSWTGRIIDRDTRAPLPRALVWPENDPGRWVWTDADGAFRLNGIAAPLQSGLAAAALDHAPGVLSFQSGLPGRSLVLALAPAAALLGIVVDGRDQPLANVQLSVSLLGGIAGEREAHGARTSADGVFRAPGLRVGASYLVTATLPGFAPTSTAVAISQPGAPVPGLRLVLVRGRTAFGQVVDESRRPVAGARVELAPGATGRVVASDLAESKNAPQQALTDAEGTFELHHLPAGWHRLRIEAGGFLALERDGVQVPAGTARADLGRFQLQRGAAFQGLAVDPDGQPVAGAEVWIIPAEVQNWTDFYAKGPATVTGADGSFIVRDLPREESFGLDVCHAGHLPLSAIVREITAEPFRAILHRAAGIAGRVTGDGGAPVPAARIESWLAGEEPARSESLRPCRSGSGSATADSEGRFRLDALPPGWWNLRATAGGYRGATRERIHVLAGESREGVEIVLGPGAAVSGRVFTSNGEPAPGARVSAFSGAGTVQTLAAGDGAYRLAGVEPGEQTVEATLGEGTWASRSLTVIPGENRLDLTMDQGSPHQEIRGRVLGPGGEPVAGATVFATGSARTFTAADGSFLLLVEDNREYDVWAEKERFAAARANAAVHVAGAPVAGVEIRLDRGGALTGRLLGLDREELNRASVEVELVPPFLARAAVDPQGSYRIEDVPPGEWTLTARAGGRSVRERAVLPPGASEAALDLTFEPSHDVSGWISGPAGEPVAGAYIRFFAPGAAGGSTYSRSDGSFHLRLEDGTYRIVARREGYLWTAQEEPVAVDGGPVPGLELRLEEAAVIRGRILGLAPGERAKAVWISAGPAGGNRREGQLDQEGGFLVPDVPPGDWTVTVAYGGREVSVALHLPPGQDEEWVEVEMDGPRDDS